MAAAAGVPLIVRDVAFVHKDEMEEKEGEDAKGRSYLTLSHSHWFNHAKHFLFSQNYQISKTISGITDSKLGMFVLI